MEEKWLNSPSAIMNKVESSEAYKIYKRSLDLDQNLFVFERNYQDLKRAIEKCSQSEQIDLLLDRHQSEIILHHMCRFVHNFLASAMTLVEHTRIIIRENYVGTSFSTEYQGEIDKRFVNNPLHQFIQDFRNYALHYSLPITGFRISVKTDQVTGDQEERVVFFISKDTLLLWSGWKDGKVYLEELNDEIPIENLIDDYFRLVFDFHSWLHKRLQELHKNDFDWLLRMQERINELTKH
jgi:elongation factor P hydroxylase